MPADEGRAEPPLFAEQKGDAERSDAGGSYNPILSSQQHPRRKTPSLEVAAVGHRHSRVIPAQAGTQMGGVLMDCPRCAGEMSEGQRGPPPSRSDSFP